MALLVGPAVARDQIRVVGSPVVAPFTTVVGDAFSKATGMKAPVVEETTTGSGMQMFCAGIGENFPDYVNASRRMKKAEFEDCAKNGVTEIVEIKVGFDGITLATTRDAKDFGLSNRFIFMALAKNVPDQDGKLVANPYKMWNEIDPALPAMSIKVLGPISSRGTYESFLKLMIENGARTFHGIAEFENTDPAAFEAIWRTIREDGVYVRDAKIDTTGVAKLQADPELVGILSYKDLHKNKTTLKGIPIDDIAVTFDTIADGSYRGSRPLYLYAKKQHVGVVPGIKEFIDEYVSDNAAGSRSYLANVGLVSLPSRQMTKVRAIAAEMEVLKGRYLD